jgi:hypothetical protein
MRSSTWMVGVAAGKLFGVLSIFGMALFKVAI